MCRGLVHCGATFASTNKKNKVMKTTISNISSMFSSEESFKALVDMIDDMDLELLDVCFA